MSASIDEISCSECGGQAFREQDNKTGRVTVSCPACNKPKTRKTAQVMVKGVKYRIVPAPSCGEDICRGCAAEHDSELCLGMPWCGCALGSPVIYVRRSKRSHCPTVNEISMRFLK